jgi:hypothetical protein
MIETSASQLATRGDRCTVKGKYFQLLPSNVGTFSVPFVTDAFGTRVAAIANQYSRWKIERLIFKVAPGYTSTGGRSSFPFAVAVLDDNSGEGGSVQIPNTAAEVLSIRCSTLQLGDEPCMFKWNPIDPNKWYYTEAGGTGSDNRLVIPATFTMFSGTSEVLSAMEVHYTITFEGAKQSFE